ncbi:MAG: nitrite/sulfite reductase [Kiritimatiellae bacterium]|nr:nitrite/sulfite reductase [Kiritimatiellia bacterium]
MSDKEELTQAEKDKLNYGFDFDFKAIAERPLEDIAPGELVMYKWSGVYQQLQKGFFMLRLRIPGGLLESAQLRTAGVLAQEYANDQLCVTTRQCLQFHWVRKEDLYKIMEGMAAVGILSKNACGDVTRNVVTCPLAGLCEHEVTDTTAMLNAIADDPEMLNYSRNLPRKHKISVAGCGRACALTLMNCQGWYPYQEDGAVFWKFHAGGGLGAKAFTAKAIFERVPGDLVVEVAKASCEVFNRLGNRQRRNRARLKFLVHDLGPDGYAAEVMKVLREREVSGLERIVVGEHGVAIARSYLQGQSTLTQKVSGLNVIRVMLKRGEFTSDDAARFAQLAEQYGDGTMTLTARQNLIFRNVPDASREQLVAELRKSGYQLEGFEHIPDMVACVGATVCNLAVTDTTVTYRELMDELTKDVLWWKSIGYLLVHINGCHNSCGHQAIADLGLRGMRKKTAAGLEDGYTIFVGGSLMGAGCPAVPLCNASANLVASAIKAILNIYLEHRNSDAETFSEFARRFGVARFKELLRNKPELAQFDPSLAGAEGESEITGG